jgi:hypothetical protein
MYMYIHVYEFINMCIHVCAMFKHMYDTVLQYLVQGVSTVRIPDGLASNSLDFPKPGRQHPGMLPAGCQQKGIIQ